VKGDRHVTMAW